MQFYSFILLGRRESEWVTRPLFNSFSTWIRKFVLCYDIKLFESTKHNISFAIEISSVNSLRAFTGGKKNEKQIVYKTPAKNVDFYKIWQTKQSLCKYWKEKKEKHFIRLCIWWFCFISFRFALFCFVLSCPFYLCLPFFLAVKKKTEERKCGVPFSCYFPLLFFKLKLCKRKKTLLFLYLPFYFSLPFFSITNDIHSHIEKKMFYRISIHTCKQIIFSSDEINGKSSFIFIHRHTVLIL